MNTVKQREYARALFRLLGGRGESEKEEQTHQRWLGAGRVHGSLSALVFAGESWLFVPFVLNCFAYRGVRCALACFKRSLLRVSSALRSIFRFHTFIIPCFRSLRLHSLCSNGEG
uniref:Uncharacterized protein n=1 Tax=Trypanosoma congolense (strain IL3000) TaxID=1068625 RepID=G0US32_TRYCI|nr:hypothetical protein, unlikely [Trypanosoma congolense IL3000]